MKQFLILFILLFNLTVIAQSESYAGTYERRSEMNDGSIFEYTINLNSHGTFLFHSYEMHTKTKSPEQHKYGKGKWEADKNIISFSTDEQLDLDETHELNFSNTRARIDRKSPRNKSPEIIPDLMRFFSSDISWVEGKKLVKTN